jgi:hypothetical protein
VTVISVRKGGMRTFSLRMDLGCDLKYSLRREIGALAFLFARSRARPRTLIAWDGLFWSKKGDLFYFIMPAYRALQVSAHDAMFASP